MESIERTLRNLAKSARSKRLMDYYSLPNSPHPEDTENDERSPLMGYCYENTRELSFELHQANIPHRIVYGSIAHDAVGLNPSTPYFQEHIVDNENIDITEYINSETGVVADELWEQIPYPKSSDQLPPESSHYWVEVFVDETIFGHNKAVKRPHGIGDEYRYHVEIAAEAREHYDSVFVSQGRQTDYYLMTHDSYVQPWENDDQWDWNPRKIPP